LLADALGWSSEKWSKASGRATVGLDQVRPRLSMSIPTQLDYIRCIAQSHWKIPAFGYINNKDHRLVEPGQIFDERDTSDRAHVLLSGVARITCRNRKGRRAVVIMTAPGMIPAFPLPVVRIL